jgi:hypothetical protein
VAIPAPKETAMKQVQYSWLKVLPLSAVFAAFLVGNQPLVAQPNNQDVSAVHTFAGTIVKSENKVVLSDTYNQTIFQLDDQQKAQDFLNKSVRVTGILDPSTGTIHVTAIEPV